MNVLKNDKKMIKKIRIIGIMLLFCSIVTAQPNNEGKNTPTEQTTVSSNNNIDNKLKELDSKISQMSNQWLWITIIVEGVLLIITFSYLLSKYFYLNDRIDRNKLRFENYSNKNSTSNNNFSNGKAFEDKLQSLERRIGTLQQEISDFKNNSRQIGAGNHSFVIQSPSSEKFLKMKSGVYLSQESPTANNSKYKIFDMQGNSAKFEFCGNEREAIANREAFFDNVCDDSNYSIDAKRVINEQPGMVELQNDGKWKVIIKAKIKFL
jgi:hypothetical protein